MMSRASICWVVRIVPNSEAMFEPTFPERMRHMILEENSKSMISRVTYPETQLGIQALWILSLICIQMTAPIKKEMRRTMPMESTPSCDISLMYCLKNMRIRSGREKVRPMSMR